MLVQSHQSETKKQIALDSSAWTGLPPETPEQLRYQKVKQDFDLKAAESFARDLRSSPGLLLFFSILWRIGFLILGYTVCMIVASYSGDEILVWIRATETVTSAVAKFFPNIETAASLLHRRATPERIAFVRHVLAWQWVLGTAGLSVAIIQGFNISGRFRELVQRDRVRTTMSGGGWRFILMLMLAAPFVSDEKYLRRLSTSNLELLKQGLFVTGFVCAIAVLAAYGVGWLARRHGRRIV